MSSSYGKRRESVGQNQHRPGEKIFTVSNSAVLMFFDWASGAAEDWLQSFSLVMAYFSLGKLWSFGISMHGTCSQPKVELCP